MDRIDQIAAMAITFTLTVMRTTPLHFGAALAGLERLRHDLKLDVPDHPAIERLRVFLDDLELRAAEKPFH